MNSTRISQSRLKVIEKFSVSTTDSWLFDVVVMNNVIDAIGCESKSKNFCFWIEKPRLINLILNSK